MSINKAILILVLLLSAGQGIAGDFPSLGDAYDVNRDAAEDFRRAAVEARKQGKKILIEAGGEWCSWCHILDKYLADNESVRRELLSVFVFLKVNVSPENQNKAFLSRYPPIKGYPAFIIVDHDGNLLGRQNTGKLETRSGYSDSAFLKFIAKWKDKAGDTK